MKQIHANPQNGATHLFRPEIGQTLMKSEVPDVVVHAIDTRNGRLHIAREDLLPGGTKQRACIPYLHDQIEQGYTSFVYASPFAGFAQVALAISAKKIGCRVILFCERDPNVPQKALHHFSKLAQGYGAEVHLTETLEEAEMLATKTAAATPECLKIPLGFDSESFRTHLHSALVHQFQKINGELNTPKRVWVSLGSGTLTKIFREVLPASTEIHSINVHVLKDCDDRIQCASMLPNTTVYSAPEKFHETALDIPPLASNIHYDSKVWQFLNRYGKPGDLWWNVAR